MAAKTRKIEGDVHRLFGISAAQAALILRAYETERQVFERKGFDRDVTIHFLMHKGYLKLKRVATDAEVETREGQIKTTARKAKELLPDEWDKAAELLQHCAFLRNEAEGQKLALTEKGEALAKKMADAGYTYDRVRFKDE